MDVATKAGNDNIAMKKIVREERGFGCKVQKAEEDQPIAIEEHRNAAVIRPSAVFKRVRNQSIVTDTQARMVDGHSQLNLRKARREHRTIWPTNMSRQAKDRTRNRGISRRNSQISRDSLSLIRLKKYITVTKIGSVARQWSNLKRMKVREFEGE